MPWLSNDVKQLLHRECILLIKAQKVKDVSIVYHYVIANKKLNENQEGATEKAC